MCRAIAWLLRFLKFFCPSDFRVPRIVCLRFYVPDSVKKKTKKKKLEYSKEIESMLKLTLGLTEKKANTCPNPRIRENMGNTFCTRNIDNATKPTRLGLRSDGKNMRMRC